MTCSSMDTSCSRLDFSIGVCSLSPCKVKHLCKVRLNDVSVQAFIDSGNLGPNAISCQMLKRLKLSLNDLVPLNKTIGTAHSKGTIKVIGQVRKKLPMTFEGYDKQFFTRLNLPRAAVLL